ncbi:MAG: 2-succinyl-5-enolpyruvyl-6-hydroxy-3-cyclohexene-1-carboxylic-acid synthase [Bacteroidota bacterium]|nr:2-succinyl-5-enolpyruvyl-6-hydroxy-3-cyclohexene-1-carboxylic-acid synthase [Bacteroidota bacterium]
MMISNKAGVQLLASILKERGVRHMVISPGSRNAPLINTFGSSPHMKTYSIVDERSAAFFALGMARLSGEIVALSCTSGTAALNYAPAIAEAYYQKVPLLVLTADRPVEWIDQGDGQTIRQKNVYSNYTRKSFELPQKIENQNDRKQAQSIILDAIDACTFPVSGPVHINLPFEEPLYGYENIELSYSKLPVIRHDNLHPDEETLKEITGIIKNAGKIMILAGQMLADEKLNELLEKFSALPHLIVLSETNSNLENAEGIYCIDRCLALIPPGKEEAFSPDLLITIGDAIVSKRIKSFLRKFPAEKQIHVNPDPHHPDTFKTLTHNLFMDAVPFLEKLLPEMEAQNSNYHVVWMDVLRRSEKLHADYLTACEFTDLKAFEIIFDKMPADIDLYLGNSSPVRYGQLFRHSPRTRHLSNRGTSGIDGCLSTAVGGAQISSKPSLIILGDLTFFYDSNALWNNYVSDKLRIIVINNGGGNIFRIIEGPDQTAQLEEFYEAAHQRQARDMAAVYGLACFAASGQEELEKALPGFFSENLNKAAVLEVFTDRELSPRVLRNYFKYLSGINE